LTSPAKQEPVEIRSPANFPREETIVARVTPAPTQQEHGKNPRVAESTSVDIDQQHAWDTLLTAVQKEKISVFFALKSGRLLDITPTSLHIGLEKEPYFKELARKENVALLETAAKRAFGRSLTVEIIKGTTLPTTSGKQPSPLPAAVKEQTPSLHSQPIGDDPLVKTVLDVLGGEVQATRSHRISNDPSR
jgi:hypothetical protein